MWIKTCDNKLVNLKHVTMIEYNEVDTVAYVVGEEFGVVLSRNSDTTEFYAKFLNREDR